jgi:nicotinamide-nucleotide amidase
MQTMWHNVVLPRLSEKRSAVIVSRIIKTWGLSESKVDELVSPFLGAANPTLAMYAKPDGIQLRITARETTPEAAADLIARREHEIKELLKENIWGFDEDTLEGLVARLLSQHSLSLAVAESFTGGLLAYSLSITPEGAGFFRGGLVIPMNARAGWELKEACAGSASRMASLAREKFDADIGLAIDGYSEPGPVMPRGKMFIAIDDSRNTEVTSPGYLGRPEQVARRTANHALISLRDFVDRTRG